MQRQRGLSVISVLFIMLIVGAGFLLAGKVLPVYNEYAEVRKAVTAMAGETGKGDIELRREFMNHAMVGGISSIKPENLTIITTANSVFVRAAYRREVPLFANVSLAFDFDTQAGQTPQ
ncbi:DUF4845 domain-containing protein [Aquitalea aquatica]|uniref:DUF4845 domain-containing protein n=1 Tax=Aquitalea aquatica TaxID=3044273 RepID=A0A838Y8E4_9NEIS|nr:DUF4845 domain-containing protein [Aquitalea magnusonii]MBA4707064.1 DUF4845 domain-containing protein [Aquitalea magnusonii]